MTSRGWTGDCRGRPAAAKARGGVYEGTKYILARRRAAPECTRGGRPGGGRSGGLFAGGPVGALAFLRDAPSVAACCAFYNFTEGWTGVSGDWVHRLGVSALPRVVGAPRGVSGGDIAMPPYWRGSGCAAPARGEDGPDSIYSGNEEGQGAPSYRRTSSKVPAVRRRPLRAMLRTSCGFAPDLFRRKSRELFDHCLSTRAERVLRGFPVAWRAASRLLHDRSMTPSCLRSSAVRRSSSAASRSFRRPSRGSRRSPRGKSRRDRVFEHRNAGWPSRRRLPSRSHLRR